MPMSNYTLTEHPYSKHVGHVCIGRGSGELSHYRKEHDLNLLALGVGSSTPTLTTGWSGGCVDSYYYMTTCDYHSHMNKMKTPTKEQIIEVAEYFPEAKAALKKLFPDIFTRKASEGTVDSIRFGTEMTAYKDLHYELTGARSGCFLQLRSTGVYANEGLVLGHISDDAEYSIVGDGSFKILIMKPSHSPSDG